MRLTLANHQEVAHYWANKVQEEGRGSRMFFENGTIYSYGKHFAIAKHYDNGMILFTNRSYSPTTSKHISYTRQALPYDTTILYCNNPAWPQDPENLSSAISNIEYNLVKAIKARQRKADYMRDAESAYNQIIELKATFKIKGWKIPKYDFSIPENIMAVMEEKAKKAAAKRKRLVNKQLKQDKLDMVEFMADVEKWRKGEITSAYRMRHSRFINQGHDICRVNGDIVESMRQASITVKEARVALKLIARKESVKGLKLGHYTVISYDGDFLTIGCHKFPQAEIDYLRAELSL